MTEHDKDLLRQAQSLGFPDWGVAYDLAERAQTAEGRDAILDVARLLRHAEEVNAGDD